MDQDVSPERVRELLAAPPVDPAADASTNMLILDGNNFAHRVAHTMSGLITSSGEMTGVVYGMLVSLFKLMEECPCCCVVIAWDSGRSPRRMRVSGGTYKANREEARNAMTELERGAYQTMLLQMEKFREVTAALPIYNIKLDDPTEGDDIMAVAAYGAAYEVWDGISHATIVSGDKDMLQLTDENISIYYNNFKGYRMVTPKNFQEMTTTKEHPLGFPSAKSFLVKYFLQGDRGDGVAGVTGLGSKVTYKILEACGWPSNVPDLLARCSALQRQDAPDTRTFNAAKKLLTAPVGNEINMAKRLVDLGYVLEDKAMVGEVIAQLNEPPPEADMPRFWMWCRAMEMASLVRRTDEIEALVRRLQ